MITYDYIIERDIGGGEIQKFTPDAIPTKLPNLVYIEAPNSSGKSTLLHLIALGLYGLKNRKINNSLQSKMKSFMNNEYQKLKFIFKIESDLDDYYLKFEKPHLETNEVLVYEGSKKGKEKPISYDLFQRKYNLIYDIPDNPLERLQELSEEIRLDQLRFGTKIAEFEHYLRAIMDEIENSRDQVKIDEYEGFVKKFASDVVDLNISLSFNDDFLDILEQYAYLKYYGYYKTQYDEIERQINLYNNKSKSMKRGKKKVSNRYKKIKLSIEKKLSDLNKLYYETTDLLSSLLKSKEKNHMNIWKRILVSNILDFELDINLDREIIYFLNVIEKLIEMEESKEYYKSANLIEKILVVLNDFEDYDYTIPDINIKMQDLKKIFENEREKYRLSIVKYENMINARKFLIEMSEYIIIINEELTEIKELSKSVDDSVKDEYDDFEIKNIINELNNQKDIFKAKYLEYYNKCVHKEMKINEIEDGILDYTDIFNNNEQLMPYYNYTENQLLDKITQLERENNNIRKDINEKKYYINQYNKDIKNMNNKKEHKYQNNKGNIEDIIKNVFILRQKILRDYNENIIKILKNNIKDLKSNSELEYLDLISIYLANRIGVFRHIDKEYVAIKLDLKNGIINTQDGFKINFIDMGTGQTQSAYISSLLNTRDERIIIAMFDEIAMMDETSLKPIYEKMKNLYNDKKLLTGIMVQKGEKVNIININE